jgi:hypothetical protein
MTSWTIIMGGMAALSVAMTLLAAMFGRALFRQRRDFGALSLELETMRRELSALCTGALGAGNHLDRIDRQMLRLIERQNRLEEREVSEHDYDRATKLIRAGAGVERIVKECGLPRAEVELLLRMHATAARVREAQGVSGMRASGVPM